MINVLAKTYRLRRDHRWFGQKPTDPVLIYGFFNKWIWPRNKIYAGQAKQIINIKDRFIIQGIYFFIFYNCYKWF